MLYCFNTKQFNKLTTYISDSFFDFERFDDFLFDADLNMVKPEDPTEVEDDESSGFIGSTDVTARDEKEAVNGEIAKEVDEEEVFLNDIKYVMSKMHPNNIALLKEKVNAELEERKNEQNTSSNETANVSKEKVPSCK